MTTPDPAKLAAAEAAVALAEDGMRLGLGTGSTAAVMVRALAARVAREGLALRFAATSEGTARLAASLGLRIEALDEIGWLDLTIDGADELDPDLNLIKGGGGALLREKIVEQASDRFVVIADAGKVVERLGAFPLPVEVIPFGWRTSRRQIAGLLAEFGLGEAGITLRGGEASPFRTDEDNLILDLHLQAIPDAPALGRALNRIAGVVENGLFIDMAERALVGRPDGSVTVLTRPVSAE